MKLIAGGDSFVWGSELEDHKHGSHGGHSQSTFPAILAGQYKLDYECVALPGSGNDSITRRVIEACHDQDDIAVLVSWTWSARYEFRFVHDQCWTTVNARQYEIAENTDTPHGDFIQHFFRSVGFSDYWETYSSLREMMRLQDYLALRKIPYMFTITDNWFAKAHSIKHADTSIRSLYSQIDWNHWYFFPPSTDSSPRGFYQWAAEEDYELAPQHHPLERAHRDAADMMSHRFLTLMHERP